MFTKMREKEKAIKLRKEGLSYSEILKEVVVSRSTLSLWLREVGLSLQQQQRLTAKKLESMKRGWISQRQKRISVSNVIYNEASRKVGDISERELLLIGATLYWAEGSKQKAHNISQGVIFTNSDSNMIRLFLVFVRKILSVNNNDIKFELYIHKGNDVEKAKRYWSQILNQPIDSFGTVYFKDNKTNTKRKNIDEYPRRFDRY